jgi:hypothetical protein
MHQQITVNGVAVELERGFDWKGRDVYFAVVGGVRKSFNTSHWALTWAKQQIESQSHCQQPVSHLRIA